jgi:hypothetical protein
VPGLTGCARRFCNSGLAAPGIGMIRLGIVRDAASCADAVQFHVHAINGTINARSCEKSTFGRAG